VRCLIVDDSVDFIDAARGLLERQGVAVVGAASSGAEAIRRFEELRPDVTLVDIDLGGESGFDVVNQLHRAAASAASPLILISTHALEDFADMVATSPAIGFVSKSALSAEVIHRLISASAGVQVGDDC
jgi:DNA-binding NarL/FixJ family response regulator